MWLCDGHSSLRCERIEPTVAAPVRKVRAVPARAYRSVRRTADGLTSSVGERGPGL